MAATLICDVITPDGLRLGDMLECSYDVSYDRVVRTVSGLSLANIPSGFDPNGRPWFGITPNDDPSVNPEDQGFLVVVDVRWTDRRGIAQLQTLKVAIPTSSVNSAGEVPLSTCDLGPVPLPYFTPGSDLSGVAVWTDPNTGEQIPYLVEPTDGTLTTIGH